MSIRSAGDGDFLEQTEIQEAQERKQRPSQHPRAPFRLCRGRKTEECACQGGLMRQMRQENNVETRGRQEKAA
jgi:hypothetical protein